MKEILKDLAAQQVPGANADIVAKKMKLKFAKEFFVTERGEVVKMAGIVT